MYCQLMGEWVMENSYLTSDSWILHTAHALTLQVYFIQLTDPKSVLVGNYKMTALYRNHGVTPYTPLKGVLIRPSIFMSFFFAINNMVEKVPSLKGGGIFWFTDLTTPDPLYILPVLTSLTFLATVELGNPYIASKMKMLHRGMGVMIVPFTMNFAKV
uniref:Membrane insertase YidC/Oxa/ALB C-terminal domain-containing protein n=1 Tax=Aegilops tauschii subsp. strangulata TaxID=200361 RepID=A0A452YNE6_AEGTS